MEAAGIEGRSTVSAATRRVRAIGLGLTVLAAAAAGGLIASGSWSPGTVVAASCTGKSDTMSLQGGAATPGSGTTATPVEFSARYVDSPGCTPTSITVAITGVGTYPMSPIGSGTTYISRRTLPAGTWSYHFAAVSGSGAGLREFVLTTVSPSRVVIAGATPKPTTKQAVESANTATPARVAAAPGGGPSPTATAERTGPTEAPTPARGSGDGRGSTPYIGPDGSPHPVTASVVRGSDAGPGSGEAGAGLSPANPLGSRSSGFELAFVFVTWVLLATIGSILFAQVLFRRNPPDHPHRRLVHAIAAHAPAGTTAHPASSTHGQEAVDDPHVEEPIDSESHIPRWRRPSLQAARQSRSLNPVDGGQPLRFEPGQPPHERRVVAFRLVRVADRPDDDEGEELGRVDRGDEVEVLERHEAFALVRTPDGLRGWIDATTLVEPPDSEDRA